MPITAAVISSKTSSERRRIMTEQLNFIEDIKWNFFDALNFNSKIPGLDSNPDLQLREYGRLLTEGEIGCFKSHISLLSCFIDSCNADWLLVIEDDVYIDPYFSVHEVVTYAIKNNINYIRLFAKSYQRADVVDMISNFRQIIRFRTDPYGTQAYLINKNGCKSLLNKIHCITVPIDDLFGRFWEHGLDAYCVFPFPAIERNLQSALTLDRNALESDRAKFRVGNLINRIELKVKKLIYNCSYGFRRKFRRFSRRSLSSSSNHPRM